MTDLETLYARNREFASCFHYSESPGALDLSMVILTCVDARICPAQFMQLDAGEAFVIRKPGGRVTQDVERDVAILAALSARRSRRDAPPFELVIIHHTDCGMEGLADPARRRELARRSGVPEEQLLTLAIADHEASLRADIDKLRDSGVVPPELVVSGHIYDVESGALRQSVAPAPLGSAPPGRRG
jgi:carbonic anhydrase